MLGSKTEGRGSSQRGLSGLLRLLYTHRYGWRVCLAALAGLSLIVFMSGCGSNKAAVTVRINPASATVILGGSQLFVASVANASNQGVTWSVSASGVTCTGSSNPCGTISSPTPTSPATYVAPMALPSPTTNMVTVTATSVANSSAKASATVTLDSGIRVSIAPATATLGTGEFLALTPTVTGLTSGAANTVTWMVNGTANGNSTVGQICVNANPTPTTCTAPGSSGTVTGTAVFFVAPTTAPTGNTTVTATAVADTTRSGTATITVLTATNPVLNSISPGTAAQGSVFQDVYLTGTSFFSTSTVLAGFGTNLVPVETIFLSTTLLRARIPSCPSSLSLPGCGLVHLLEMAGTLNIEVQRQNGTVSGSQQLTVAPQRPALLAVAPESEPQCSTPVCSAQTVLLTGGYYLPPPMTTALFNGSSQGIVLSQNAVNPTTQLNVTLPNTATTTAGLFPLVLQNAGNPAMSGINIAIQPAPSVNPASTIATATVGMSPVAVAINTATGKAVTANSGDNTISVIDLSSCGGGTCSSVVSMPVGMKPTSVAVDNQRNLALVVNQTDKTVSVVDLSGAKATFTIGLPATCPVASGAPMPPPLVPVAIGENPVTGHATIANQSTNCATVIDITQNPATVGTDTLNIGTGMNPHVTVEPKLDWAVIAPGGSGSVAIVDMNPDHQIVNPNISSTQLSFFTVASVIFPTTVQGVGLNTETEQAFFTDPSGTFGRTFSILDQTVANVILGGNFVDAAVNPLTNVGFAINNQTNVGSLADLERTAVLASGIPLGPAGSNPVAVAIDPVTDEAVVANQGNNTIIVLSLGAIRPLQVVQMSPPQLIVPANNATDQMITVTGSGFVSGSTVRLDTTPVTTQFVSNRVITATVPAAMLQTPRRYVVDVANPDGSVSNITELGVITSITVGMMPGAVAIDEQRNLAVITNTGDNTADLVDLTLQSVVKTINVGMSPQGAAVIPHLGLAVVPNNVDGTASVIDVVGQALVGSAVAVGQAPIGVAINQDTALTVVANSASNNLSFFAANNPSTATGTLGVDLAPIGVSIDVNRDLAAVTCATQSFVDVVDLTARSITGRAGGSYMLPKGVAFDPVTDMFLVANSEINNIVVFDPANLSSFQNILTGINPTSIGYNFQSNTILTANSLSHTVSVLDFLGKHVRSVVIVDGSPTQSVAIHSQTNLAVVADQAHNRILLVPPPH